MNLSLKLFSWQLFLFSLKLQNKLIAVKSYNKEAKSGYLHITDLTLKIIYSTR